MDDTLQAVLRSDLNAFIEKVFETVSPGIEYKQNWHIQAVAHQLNRCSAGENKRLLITQPPRSLKSICTSVAYPAWVLGHNPELEIICVSYSEGLAKELARQFLMVVQSKWYKELFPGTRMTSNTSLLWRTRSGGGRIATTTGGTLTGLGADIIVIDDPLKAEDAQSQVARENLINWYRGTLLSRLNDKTRGVILLVMQRLHEDDLAGLVLEEGDWHHLDLPAIAVEPQEVEIGPGEFYSRKTNEVLHGAHEPREVLDALKRAMGTMAFTAQYQQRPVPLEGNLIMRKWFKYYDQLPDENTVARIIQSWDIATSVKETNDYSVCTTWAVKNKKYYLTDVWRGRLMFPDLKKKIIAHAKRYEAQTILIEKAGPGLHLVQELRNVPGIPIPIAIQPKGDKVQRMEAQSSKIEAGQVYLPREADWLGDFLNELLAFPKGKHDDQVDSVSQFLNWIARSQYRESTEGIAPPIIVVCDTGGEFSSGGGYY